MKSIFTIFITIIAIQFGFSQELSESEKKQAAIITQAILDANKKEKEIKNNSIQKPEKIIVKGVCDTIVVEKNYETDSLYKNLEHLSFEVKDGIMYAKFRADLLDDITENQKIENYKLVISTARTISAGDDKVFIYATTANKGKYLSTGKWGLSFGLLTVPFKIRPATNDLPSESKADIKNVNLFFGGNYVNERIFWNNRTSSHRWMFGGMTGLSSETLTNLNSDEPLFKDSPTNQVYLTLAAGIGYSYKDKISLVFLPAGVDTGFSGTAKKWIYNGNYWWGFGIGIDFSNMFHI